MPRADILSVTRSDVVARSAFPASDILSIGSIPPIICCVSQPAKAIYSIALADSLADLVVSLPISIAFCFKSSIPSAVALLPKVPSTEDRADSKFIPVLTDAVSPATTGTDTPKVADLPTL